MLATDQFLDLLKGSPPPLKKDGVKGGYEDLLLEAIVLERFAMGNERWEKILASLDEDVSLYLTEHICYSEESLISFAPLIEYLSLFTGSDVLRTHFFENLKNFFPLTKDDFLPYAPDFENVPKRNRCHSTLQYPDVVKQAHDIVQEPNTTLFCLKVLAFCHINAEKNLG